jgi:hypothetical protein
MKSFLGTLGPGLTAAVAAACFGQITENPILEPSTSDSGLGAHDGATVRDGPIDRVAYDAGVVCNGATETGFGPGPPGQSYGAFDGGVAGSPNDCSFGIREMCGSEEYGVVCSCPQQTCTCYVGGQAVASGVTPSVQDCPQCSIALYDELAGACGFPQ